MAINVQRCYTQVMDLVVKRKLIELNNTFYDDFAASFSTTRSKLQEGVTRLAGTFPFDANILDLGCGNGYLLKHLAEHGFLGKYVGIDFSARLLEKAKSLNKNFSRVDKAFLQADLADDTWAVSFANAQFDIITAFAALHHIPGNDLRGMILKTIHQILSPKGLFVLSTWQFQNSTRLMKRILPWDTVGIRDDAVDNGDYLLDWRAEMGQNKVGYRYVHLFSQAELDNLAGTLDFQLEQEFYSDGKEGNLALYQVWKKK